MFPIPLLSSPVIIYAGLLLGALVLMLITRLSFAQAGWRWQGWTAPALGIGIGALLGTGIIAWLRFLMQTGNYLPISETVTRGEWLLLVGIAPVIEEIVFRGVIFGALQRSWSLFWAVFLSAVAYTLFHLAEPWIAIIFFLGAAYAVAFRLTGSVLAPILAHALAAAALLLARRYPVTVRDVSDTALLTTAGVCLVVSMLSWLLLRRNAGNS